MGRFLDLLGTTKQSFLVSLNGVRLKNDSGNLKVRNKADNAYTDVYANTMRITSISLGGVTLTPTATEFNYLSGVTSAIQTQLNAKQGSLGYTAENAANKDIDGTLAANSDTKYPSQKAIKTYADGHINNTNNPHSVTKSQVGLGSVENTALSTWAGSTSITTLGAVTNITPGANFTLTQNSVIPFTSVASGAVADTLYLNAGKVGIGTSTPSTALSLGGGGVISQQTTSDQESATLGSELLTGSGWTSTDWTGSFPTFTHTTGNTSVLSNTFAAVVNNLYQITYTISGRTAGTVTITFGGQSISSVSATGAFGPKATTTGTFSITPTTDFDGTITISIKQITGTVAPIFFIKDSTGTNNFEIRQLLNSTNTLNIGNSAGRSQTTASYCTNIGNNSGRSQTTASYCTNIGNNSGRSQTTAINCTNIGNSAGYSQTTAINCTNIGNAAGYSQTTAANCTNIGLNAGRSQTTAANCTNIGYATGYHASQKVDASNSMALGANTYTTANNQIVIGDTSITETILRGTVNIVNGVTNQTLQISETYTDANNYSRLKISATGSGYDFTADQLGTGIATRPFRFIHARTLSSNLSDEYAAALRLVASYSGSYTVTRHNYIDVLNPTLTNTTLIDACVMRFDANAGTHKAVDVASTKTTPGAVDAWFKFNVNGTIFFVPGYISKTA